MVRPILVDVAACVLPLLIGAAALLTGMCLPRRRRAWLLSGTCVSILFLVSLALVQATALHDVAAALIYHLGGAGRLAAWPACLLLGIVWGTPNRTWSTGFTVFVTVFLAAMLLLGSGGRLLWRCCGGNQWQHVVNDDGALTQSNTVTCGPASAAMLLQRYGIIATEGEMAYLSDTSLLGVSLHGLAHALDTKAEATGWCARVECATYDAGRACQAPFIAEMRVLGLKTHAIFVERLAEDHAEVIDPWWGKREKMPRAYFEETWTGRMVRLGPQKAYSGRPRISGIIDRRHCERGDSNLLW